MNVEDRRAIIERRVRSVYSGWGPAHSAISTALFGGFRYLFSTVLLESNSYKLYPPTFIIFNAPMHKFLAITLIIIMGECICLCINRSVSRLVKFVMFGYFYKFMWEIVKNIYVNKNL